eukprot:1649983-Rhodomonas_salina.1
MCIRDSALTVVCRERVERRPRSVRAVTPVAPHVSFFFIFSQRGLCVCGRVDGESVVAGGERGEAPLSGGGGQHRQHAPQHGGHPPVITCRPT